MSMLFGTNNYVYVPYNAGFDTLTGPMTIACWANIQTAGSMQMFINRQVSATAGNEWWSLNLMSQALRALIGNTSSVSAVQGTTITALALNTWYHCAMTYDGTNILLYQDAVLIGSGTRTMTFPADTTGVVVGANAQGAGDTAIAEYTLGYLEDMRLYNRVLSQNELTSIRSCMGRDYLYDGLLFRLALDEAAQGVVASGAGSVKDSGPRGMHGTPYGSCIYGPSLYELKRLPNTL